MFCFKSMVSSDHPVANHCTEPTGTKTFIRLIRSLVVP